MADYGLQFIDPQRIRVDPPLEPGWESTKDGGAGTSRETIDGCVNHIPAVREKIDAGFQPEDFDRLRHSDNAEDKGTGDSYAMFWGVKPVDVTREGDHFAVSEDGRHRVQAAQENGLDRIPANYTGPEGDPEFAGKLPDAARLPHGGVREDNDMSRRGEYFEAESGHRMDPPETEASRQKDNPQPNGQDDAHSMDGSSSQSQANFDARAIDPGDGSQPGGEGEHSVDGAEAAPEVSEGESGDTSETPSSSDAGYF